MGLGINKDLEPLVRRARREGWIVEVTASTHVKWTDPTGQVHWTGLTMSSASAQQARRRLEAVLNGSDQRRFEVRPGPSEKFWVYDLEAEAPVQNGNGYPRTFGDRATANKEARRLDRER